MQTRPRHILVIHIASLSETTLALPALQSLRQHFAHARISIVGNAITTDLLRLSGCADEILPMVRVRGMDLPGPRSLILGAQSIGKIRRSLYDLAIELKPGADAGFIVYLARPEQRFREERRPLEAFFERLARVGAPRSPMHLAHQYLKRLEPLGVRPVVSAPHISTDKAADGQFDKLLDKNHLRLGEILVGIHPGGRRSLPRWPLERFASIGARLIHNYNARVLVFAGPSERGLAKRLVSMLPPKHAIAMESPRLQLFISAAARLSLFIGHHSGPAHVAAAAGAPVVAISTSTGATPRDLLFPHTEHLRAAHPELIHEEDVYAAACRLLRLNRADFLLSG